MAKKYNLKYNFRLTGSGIPLPLECDKRMPGYRPGEDRKCLAVAEECKVCIGRYRKDKLKELTRKKKEVNRGL